MPLIGKTIRNGDPKWRPEKQTGSCTRRTIMLSPTILLNSENASFQTSATQASIKFEIFALDDSPNYLK